MALEDFPLACPSDCPRYDSCSAALCPIDFNWRKRMCDSSSRTCFFLAESVKPGAGERLESWILAACNEMASAPDLPGHLKRTLASAAKSGSRIEAGRQRLREGRKRAVPCGATRETVVGPGPGKNESASPCGPHSKRELRRGPAQAPAVGEVRKVSAEAGR